MSGDRLFAVLSELGFDGQDALDPDSFEWPFQYEEARPVLEWICSSLRPSNVLSVPELSQYEQFLNEGKLLEGEDLDAAFDSISAFSSKKDNQDVVFGAEERLIDIREAKLAFKAEVLELQKQLERQQSMFDLLGGQAATLIQGRRARVSASSTVNAQLSTLEEKLSERNLEMNSVLGKMASTAQELSHYHSGDENGIYLAYCDFRPYLLEDLACTKELNQWFSKQFHKGPLRLVAEEGKSKCSWVSLDELTNCLIRGDNEKPRRHHHNHNRVAELQRLRSIFATSERQWVEAQVENAKQQAILLMLKSQISSDEAHIHRDMHSLRKKHSELAVELSNLSHKEQKFLSETIPRLCSDLAQLQDTYILQGDYDLKVMRQEHYISRQKMFINNLVNQLARHRFLKIACQMERRIILGAFSLLKVIEAELEGYLLAGTGRVGHCLSLIQAALEVQEQGAVDDRDTFLHSVRDLLSIHSNAPASLTTYVSANGIVQQISGLQSDLLSLQFELENTLPDERRRCISELFSDINANLILNGEHGLFLYILYLRNLCDLFSDRCVLIQTLKQLLFSSSATAEPLLTPRPLMRALDDMEKANSQVSAFVEEVTEAHRQKAEIVKHHPHEVGRERQVFVDFFCNPDRLRNQVRELGARVKALQD